MMRVVAVTLLSLLALTGVVRAQTFSDLAPNHWAHDAVEKSARLGLVVGRGDGTFKGDLPPTRYELAMGMAKILAEVENRMKAQPVFTRQVLEQLRGLNTYLAQQIDEVKYGQRYLLFLMEEHFKGEHGKNLPDMRRKFGKAVAERLNKSFPTEGEGEASSD